MLLPAWSLLSQNSALKPCIAMASNGIKRGSALKQYASSCSITSTRRHAMCDVACTYPQLTCKYHMLNVLLSQVTQLGFDMLFDSIKWCKPCTSAKKPGKIQRIWNGVEFCRNYPPAAWSHGTMDIRLQISVHVLCSLHLKTSHVQYDFKFLNFSQLLCLFVRNLVLPLGHSLH